MNYLAHRKVGRDAAKMAAIYQTDDRNFDDIEKRRKSSTILRENADWFDGKFSR